MVALEYTGAAEGEGASVTMDGQKKSSSTGGCVGDFPVAATVGFPVGLGEIVGRGDIVGFPVGLAEGAGEAVGLALGEPVGLGVT